jgi:methylmalonyl-CoA mutase
MLIAKLGLDGHDRGANVVASALEDAGFDVTATGLFASPAQAAKLAAQRPYDVIGVSSLGGAHGTLVPRLLRELAECDVHTPLVVGGIVPDEDAFLLRKKGVADIFDPGSTMHEIVERLANVIRAKQAVAAHARSSVALGSHSSAAL